MGLRWLLIVCMLVVNACMPPALAPVPTKGGTAFRVELMVSERMRIQATAAYIDHVTFKLFKQGTAAPVATSTVTAPLPTPITVAFGTIPDGVYTLTGEAFGTAGETLPITTGGAITSSNTATVTAGVPTYSTGTAFNLNLQLVDGGIASIPVTITGPAGALFSASLVTPSGSVVVSYATTASTFRFDRVDTGTYQIWAGIMNGATGTISKVSVNTVTVNKAQATYSNAGAALAVSVTGSVQSLTPVMPTGIVTQVSQPGAVLPDGAGNAYIVDTNNSRILKMAADGTVTAFAGTGRQGFNGDGGPAVNAELSVPAGIALSTGGTLYIADSGNNRIRAVSSSGTITTVVGTGAVGLSANGTIATSALINGPQDVAVDSAGNLLIADAGNNRVRMVPLGAGTHFGVVMTAGRIYTVAGSGGVVYGGEGQVTTAAGISDPRGIALDAANNLYISAFGHSRVRMVPRTTATFFGQAMTLNRLYTIAGSGLTTFDGDGVLATTAGLNQPNDVALDSAGNVFIADKTNHRIRLVAKNAGTLYGQAVVANDIYTIAGDGTGTFGADGGAATATSLNEPLFVSVDATGKVFIADGTNQRIRTVSPAGVIGTLAGDGAAGVYPLFLDPKGIALDGSGNLYIADSGNHRVRRIRLSDGLVTLIAGTGTQGFAGDGALATAAQLNTPSGVAVDSAGVVYVADKGNHRVRKILTNGMIMPYAGDGTAATSGDTGPATAASLNGPESLALDGLGNVYIAESAGHVVRKVSSGGVIVTAAGTGVGGYSGDAGPATAAELNAPSGICVDPFGALIIADKDNHRIRKVTAAGVISTIAGTGVAGATGDSGLATAAQLNTPTSVATDPGGNVYVTDDGSLRLRKISNLGPVASKIHTLIGNGTGGLKDEADAAGGLMQSASGIAVSSTGVVYFADTYNNRIRSLQ